jgi:hypothetical protein
MQTRLSGAELSGADLSDANLEHADASRAGFGQATLRGACLFEANLEQATLSLADLRGADMRCACLRDARLREANLQGVDLTAADLRGADLALSRVDRAVLTNADLRGTRLRAIQGFRRASWIGVDIRDTNFAGAYQMRRFVRDENYIKEFRTSGRTAALIYHVWALTSDCGRSMARWCALIAVLVVLFAWLYSWVEVDYGEHKTWLSPLYFSVVTLTSLGYGDAVPMSVEGQIIAMTEVLTGYAMLGGLISIFSNRVARRAD